MRGTPLLEDVEHNVESSEKGDEALDDEGVVGEPDHIVEDAGEGGSEEVSSSEGRCLPVCHQANPYGAQKSFIIYLQ